MFSSKQENTVYNGLGSFLQRCKQLQQVWKYSQRFLAIGISWSRTYQLLWQWEMERKGEKGATQNEKHEGEKKKKKKKVTFWWWRMRKADTKGSNPANIHYCMPSLAKRNVKSLLGPGSTCIYLLADRLPIPCMIKPTPFNWQSYKLNRTFGKASRHIHIEG